MMEQRMARWVASVAVSANLILAAACGGTSQTGDVPTSTETITPSSESAQPTVIPSTVVQSTVVQSTVAQSTVVTVPDDLTRSPLTGLLIDAARATQRPIAVKIGNHPRERPPSGLHPADVVLEYQHEAVTRFMAIYQSELPDRVGPIRSARTSDTNLAPVLGQPFFVASGANAYTLDMLRDADVIDATAAHADGYFRDGGRRAPYNLFASLPEILERFDRATRQPGTVAGPISTTDQTASPVASPVASIDFRFRASPKVRWSWNRVISRWTRSQDGRPHLGADGVQISTDTVLILDSEYRTSPADASSPELVPFGSGAGYLLSGGAAKAITWSWAIASTNLEIIPDGGGEPLRLPAGNYWIEFPEKLDDFVISS